MSHQHQRNGNNHHGAPKIANHGHNRSHQQQQHHSFPLQWNRAPRPPKHYCDVPRDDLLLLKLRLEANPNGYGYKDLRRRRRRTRSDDDEDDDYDEDRNNHYYNRNYYRRGCLSEEEISKLVKLTENKLGRSDCRICHEDLCRKQEEGIGGKSVITMIGAISWCKHAFHYDCAEKWLHRNRWCPVCEAKAKTRNCSRFWFRLG